MADDIVTRLRTKYQGQLPICAEAADEIERLQIIIDNMAERNQKQNAEQLRIVRDIEANRDKWRDMATGSTDEWLRDMAYCFDVVHLRLELT